MLWWTSPRRRPGPSGIVAAAVVIAFFAYAPTPVSALPGLAKPAAPTPPLLEAREPGAGAEAGATPAGPYATTKTRIQKGAVTSATTMYPWNDGPSEITMIDASTVTTYEPGPLTTFPATVLETEVHTHRLTSLVARRAGVSTGYSLRTYTLTRAWLVYRPDPNASYLPASSPLPCGQCAAGPSSPPPPLQKDNNNNNNNKEGGGGGDDARCKAKGLRTACQRQCDLRPADGNLWCYRLEAWEYIYPELRMGRACWGDGGGNEFMQLNVPCTVGDYRIGCVPCRGEVVNWNGANWIDP